MGKPEGVIAIANAIPDMRAMTKLSIANNMLATKSNAKAAGEALGEMLKGSVILKELDVSGNAASGWATDGPSFAAGISQGLSDNRAMTKFDISSNAIRAEGGKALAAGLKGNQVIKELNISGNTLGENSNYGADNSGVIAIADVVPGMGALSKLIFGGEQYYDHSVSGWKNYEPATLEVGMTEANLSSKGLGVGDAILISAWITHKDKGAMTSLNLASNHESSLRSG